MLHRTFCLTTTLLASLALAGGCGGKRGGSSSGLDGTNIPNTPTELAAYAGNARFPATQPVNDQTLAAIVSKDKKQLKLYNFGKRNVRDVDVWVNGSFVKRIGGIAPQSNVAINTSEIYNGLGHTLQSRGEEISRVQLDTGDALLTLMGPSTE